MSKREKNKNRGLGKYIRDIRLSFEKYDINDDRIASSLNDFEAAIDKTIKSRNRTLTVLLLCLLISLLFCLVLIDRNFALQYKLSNMEYRDSLFHILMEVDSSNTISYRVRENKPITYWQLAKEVDSLKARTFDYQYLTSIESASPQTEQRSSKNLDEIAKENELLQRRINYQNSIIRLMEEKDSVVRKLLWFDNDGNLVYLVDSDKSPIPYHSLASERDSLKRALWKNENKAANLQLKLDMITENYPVRIITQGNKYVLLAPTLDSALAILPTYRDMIKYDSDINAFIVTRRR